MNKLLRLLSTALLVLGVQACSTSGSSSALQDGLSAGGGTSGASATSSAGEYVPAVVGIPSDPGPSQTYRIAPFDLLKIEVFQVDELSSEERVNEEGLVAMPLIGNVQVGGLTPREAEQAIAKQLEKNYLQNPQVNIFVSEYASHKVTVTGHVEKPGVFPLTGQTTLMQAIAMAGGLDEVAKKSEIVVFRNQPSGGVNAYVVDLDAVEEGALADPIVVADDRIVVPKSGVAVLTQTVGRVLTGWVIRAPVY